MVYTDPDARYCKACFYNKKETFRLTAHTNIREAEGITTQYFCGNCQQWTRKGTLTLETIIANLKSWKAWMNRIETFLAEKEIYLKE